MISVIIPLKKYSTRFERLREQLMYSTNDLEILIICNKATASSLQYTKIGETIISSDEPGRGNNMAKGLKYANGEIVVFLHADTLLPENWDHHIINILNNKKIAGGAFSLSFDKSHFYLQILIFLSWLLFIVTGELWGDRVIFCKTHLVKNNVNIINRPIMEDICLSHFLRKRGKTVILNKKVETSAQHFINKGFIKQTLKILFCRFWFLFNGNSYKIFNFYY